MENFITVLDIFAFTLKLNVIKNSILIFIANSFCIKNEENKVELIKILLEKINLTSEGI